MDNDAKPAVTIDTTRVELSTSWRVDYWSDLFGVNEAQLRRAVDEAGSGVSDVRRYLARQASLDSAGD
jgi:hypothetical protein